VPASRITLGLLACLEVLMGEELAGFGFAEDFGHDGRHGVEVIRG
jgi:hypothetical protein